MSFMRDETAHRRDSVQIPRHREIVLPRQLQDLAPAIRSPAHFGEREQTLVNQMKSLIGQMQTRPGRLDELAQLCKESAVVNATVVTCELPCEPEKSG